MDKQQTLKNVLKLFLEFKYTLSFTKDGGDGSGPIEGQSRGQYNTSGHVVESKGNSKTEKVDSKFSKRIKHKETTNFTSPNSLENHFINRQKEAKGDKAYPHDKAFAQKYDTKEKYLKGAITLANEVGENIASVRVESEKDGPRIWKANFETGEFVSLTNNGEKVITFFAIRNRNGMSRNQTFQYLIDDYNKRK